MDDPNIELIHIEDEIRTHNSVWTKMRGRIMASLSINDRKSLAVKTVFERESSETQYIEMRVRDYSWYRDESHFTIRVSSFFSHEIAAEYFAGDLEKHGCSFVANERPLLFILDTRNHEKMDVLVNNLEVVKPYLIEGAGNFRVFSAYCDKLIKDAAVSQGMVTQREEVSEAMGKRLEVPKDWKLTNTTMLLSDFLISKVATDKLLDFLFQELVSREVVFLGPS